MLMKSGAADLRAKQKPQSSGVIPTVLLYKATALAGPIDLGRTDSHDMIGTSKPLEPDSEPLL